MLQQCRRSSDPSGKTPLCHHLKHFDWRTLYSLDYYADMVIYFYYVIQSLLNDYLPMIKVTMCTTDKPWVTLSFRVLVKNRQRAFMRGDLVRYQYGYYFGARHVWVCRSVCMYVRPSIKMVRFSSSKDQNVLYRP